MICDRCGCPESNVSNTRMRGEVRVRTRTCLDCGHSWHTVEAKVEPGKDLVVLCEEHNVVGRGNYLRVRD